MTAIENKTLNVDGLNVFYREAGSNTRPTILLLHGFPSSSHMYRDLIPLLADQFHLVAPDLPGFGQTELRSAAEYTYSFDQLADVITRFTEILELDRFAVYVFDYGAPVGFRLAAANPEKITGIITQNGNAYTEGLSEGWNPIRRFWQEPTEANRNALRQFLTLDTTKWQYTFGVKNSAAISPDGYSLDHYYLSRPGVHEIQLDLFLDYASNLELYPRFQAYFKQHQPKLLAVWGKNDPFFLPEGAEAFKRDIPSARVKFFETGHFALETHAQEIAQEIKDFFN